MTAQESATGGLPLQRRDHPPLRPDPPPPVVAIVAMGISAYDYVKESSVLGGRQRICDETWGINAMGGILQCDRVFMQDDLPNILVPVAAENPCVAGMVEWARYHPGPIYTSKAYPEYPGSVEYPLAEVVNFLRAPYLRNTCAYAIAFAVWIRVPFLKLYGMDFTYPDRHEAEQGRACTEFMVAQHLCRGGQLHVAQHSTLMETFDFWKRPGSQFYGYIDDFSMQLTDTAEGKVYLMKKETPEDRREKTLAEMQLDLVRNLKDGSNGTDDPRRAEEGGPAVHLDGHGSGGGHGDRGGNGVGQHEERPAG